VNESLFAQVLKVVRGLFAEPTAEEKKDLFKETLLLVLARATSADANIAPSEVTEVQAIYKREIGEEIEEKDVRIAALSENYRETSYESVLSKANSYIEYADKKRISDALKEILKADQRVNMMEVEFFNKTVSALGLEASDLSVG